MGAAAMGEDNCTCYPKRANTNRSRIKQLELQIKQLQAELEQLKAAEKISF